MTTGMICVITLGIMLIGAIILAVIVTITLNNSDSIELVGRKLENSDASISDAMSYLKITNEWRD